MKTYSDLLKIGESTKDRIDFVWSAIQLHKTSQLYKTAKVAEDYDKHENTTIKQYQRLLYTVTGKSVVDNIGANYKLRSRFFNRFITQEVQFLLGNGTTWEDQSTKDVLDNNFDYKIQELARYALVGGVGFGFFDNGEIRCFKVTEFVPIYDDDNGALMAGIRFWQVANDKPMRATLYEIDGYTDYIWRNGKGEEMEAKRNYIITSIGDSKDYEDGTEIYNGENYPTFPIVPLWGNPQRQSELVGIQEQIDCYDLIKSGFANTIDEGSYIYWTIQNAGGMDDVDLAKFVERLKTVHATNLDDDEQAQMHTVESPHDGREALLDRLERDLYKDFMALDTQQIASGAVTATQIKAAYEPLNSKTDQFEYCVKEFIKDILLLAGIDDTPTFTRSMIINTQEEIGTVLESAEYLPKDYVTTKILKLFGDGDKATEILNQMEDEDESRFVNGRIAREESEEAENAGSEDKEEI